MTFITIIQNIIYNLYNSLVYQIEINDVYKDFDSNKDMFDVSEYPDNPKLYDLASKKSNW